MAKDTKYKLEKVDKTTDKTVSTTSGLNYAKLKAKFQEKTWGKISPDVQDLNKGKGLYAGTDAFFDYYIERTN